MKLKLKNNSAQKTLLALAVTGVLAACGGGSGGGTTTTIIQTTGLTQLDGKGVVSVFPFEFADSQPIVQFKEITNDDFTSTPALRGDEAFGTEVFRLGDVLPFVKGKRYLVTLVSPTDTNALYRSNTRPPAGSDCLKNAVSSSDPCPATAGRLEGLRVKWEAIVDLTRPTFKEADLTRAYAVSPLSSMIVSRARVLTTPSQGGLSVVNAIRQARTEVLSNFGLTQANLPNVDINAFDFASLQMNLENIDGLSAGDNLGMASGLLERLAQTLNTPGTQDETGGGYSAKYDQIFDAFAREGKIASFSGNASSQSVGLREAGSILNSALSQFVLRDAPRFQNTRLANYSAEDFILSAGAQNLRNILETQYPDLYTSTQGAVTSVPYIVGATGQNQAQGRNVTAVAGREGGVFFLETRGEAQDNNKARVQCKPADFGATETNYEVTGVATLEGADRPMVLAYSHTSTKAYLLDVRKIGLSNAASGEVADCALSSSAFKEVDFANVNSGDALYQAARQYQHANAAGTTKSVVLSSVSYDARANRVMLMTIDGVLAFDLLPADGGSAAKGTLPTQLSYREFKKFPSNAANVGLGLGLNPSFDNKTNILWSPFDYQQDDEAPTNSVKGVFSLDYTNVRPRFSANAIDSLSTVPESLRKSEYNGLAQTGIVGFSSAGLGNTGIVGFSGITQTNNAVAKAQAGQPADYCHTETFQDPDAGDFYTLANPAQPFGKFRIGLFDGGPIDDVVTDAIPAAVDAAGNPVDAAYSIQIQDPAGAGILPIIPGATPAPRTCSLGFHGLAMQNRFAESLGGAVDNSLYAIAPVQAYEGQGETLTRGPVGLLSLETIGATRFNAIGGGNENIKYFTLIPNRPLATPDTRELVLDDIRSYGVLRLRGSFPKTFGYFLMKDSDSANDGDLTNDYSLVEADLEAIRQIANTNGDSVGYRAPTNDQDSLAIRGPVRVYFRQ